MVYGIIELINFAHGDIFMIGAFAVDRLPRRDHGSDRPGRRTSRCSILLLVGALAFTMPLIGAAERRHRAARLPAAPQRAPPRAADHRDRRVVHPPEPRPRRRGQRRPGRRRRSSRSAGRSSSSARRSRCCSIFIFVAGLALMLALQAFVTRTRLGRAMRATAQDREAAALMGVDINQTIALTFLLGGMLAARGRRRLGPALRLRPPGPRLQRRPEGVHGGRPRRHRQHHRRGPRRLRHRLRRELRVVASASRAGREFLVFMVLTFVLHLQAVRASSASRRETAHDRRRSPGRAAARVGARLLRDCDRRPPLDRRSSSAMAARHGR